MGYAHYMSNELNLADALFAAVSTVHGESEAEWMRTRKPTPPGHDARDFEGMWEDAMIARFGEIPPRDMFTSSL